MDGTEVTNPMQGRNEEHVLDLTKFFVAEEVNPNNYYITSGEAVCKAEQLIKDLQEMLRNAKVLFKHLTDLRGDNKYLETELRDKKIILKVKNPRSMKLIPRRTRNDLPSHPIIVRKGDVLYKRDGNGFTSFCVINPDEETYSYFNWYHTTNKCTDINHKPVPLEVKVFEEKLKKKSYMKVLL